MRSTHLVGLVAATERYAAILGAARPAPAECTAMEDAAAVATLRLDGSPVTAPRQAPTRDVLTASGDAPRTATWLDVLGEVEVDEAVLDLEFAGARAGLVADDLAPALLDDPATALAALHARLTEGLVAPEVQGRPRTSAQAVHDGATGRIVYRAVEPDAVAGRLGALCGWLVTTGAREHGLVASGVLHHELLALHPFEAANGRLARTAARLVLRARGLDPHRLALVEEEIAADPLGYYEEVARTARRRDLTIWLERWGEAVEGGLRRAARRLRVLGADPPDRALAFVGDREERGFTVADYRADAGVGPVEAKADLDALLDAGLAVRVPGARGLRFSIEEETDGAR